MEAPQNCCCSENSYLRDELSTCNKRIALVKRSVEAGDYNEIKNILYMSTEEVDKTYQPRFMTRKSFQEKLEKVFKI